MAKVRRFGSALLTAGLLGSALAVTMAAPAGADGTSVVPGTCTGIPIIGSTSADVDVTANDSADPVVAGGMVTNTITVPVPAADDLPISATITEVKLTVPIPTGVTVDAVSFTPSSFTTQTSEVSGSSLVVTLAGSVPVGGGAATPTVPDVAIATTVAGPARTVSWLVPTLITARADAGIFGTFTASCTPANSSQVLLTTQITSPATAPGTPTLGTVAADEGRVRVGWAAPGADGGSDLTGYQVTATPAFGDPVVVVVDADSTDAVLDGLTNGMAHVVTVAAINAVGTGPESEGSADVTPQWWLPWSSRTVAVDEIVTSMTGVAPSVAQRDALLARLDAGEILPGDLVAELRVGSDALTNVDPSIRLYSAYLTRVPDSGGLNFWLRRRRTGWTLSRISSFFADSSEFKTRYGTLTNREFVERIYENVLGRPGEESGVVFWTGRLDRRRNDRGQVMINFSESSEYTRNEVARTDAAAVLIHLVGISPTTDRRDAFAAALEGGTPLSELVRAEIRAGSFADGAG